MSGVRVPPSLPKSNGSIIEIFNRSLLEKRRSLIIFDPFLHDYISQQLISRISFIKRSFNTVIDIGCKEGSLFSAWENQNLPLPQLSIACDICKDMIEKTTKKHPWVYSVVADDETPPFKEGAFDLVISDLSLHWVNDVPGALIQMHHMLKENGLIFGAIFGGNSLSTLKSVFWQAEENILKGVSSRFPPLIRPSTLSFLLQRANFNSPVVDVEKITLRHKCVRDLLKDIQCMGESTIAYGPFPPLSKELLLEVERLYPKDEDGKISSTLEVVYFHAWRDNLSPLIGKSSTIKQVQSF